MATPPNQAWIKFLRNYGPVSTNGNMYDETIERSRRRANVDPIRLPETFVDSTVAQLTDSKNPTSVILTGTAGDGKTYHCRQVWLRLKGTPEAWDIDDTELPGIRQLRLQDRTLLVVKDLSEINSEFLKIFFARVFAKLADPARREIFLIAANIGQLHDEWLKAAAQLEERFPQGREIWKLIEAQLFGMVVPDSTPVTVFNLGRGEPASMLGHVLTAVLEHPAWSACEGCEFRDRKDNSCPIWENRRRLREGPAGELFQQRLRELVYLKAQNGRHLTVRQLLMLTTNVLLGHPHGRAGLLTCDDVTTLDDDDGNSYASVYGNVFGENLPGRQKEWRDLFEKLGRLGIGAETSNRIDRLLTYGADDPDLAGEYDVLVGNDFIYGHTRGWRDARTAYLERGEGEEATQFLQAIRPQRQRLFFTLPPGKAKVLGLWELTVYQYADAFLRTAMAIRESQRVPTDILRRLVQGLNRVFTGRLLKEDTRLILASSGSHSQAKTSLLYEGEIALDGDAGERIEIVKGNRTDLALKVHFGSQSLPEPVALDLTVLRFEFLSRVADGALPSSFSLECHEDILAFKARVLRAFEERRRRLGSGGDWKLRFLELTQDGRIHPHVVEVLAP